jgi:hypothetical protein
VETTSIYQRRILGISSIGGLLIFRSERAGARSESGYDSNHKAGNFQRVDPGATPLSYLVTAPMEFAMDVWA